MFAGRQGASLQRQSLPFGCFGPCKPVPAIHAMNPALFWKGLCAAFVLATVPVLGAAAAPVDEAMTGHWEGRARIVVAWCRQPTLPVAIDIHPDGRVTGRVGDAELVQGRLVRNRGWLGRQLGWATDYRITAELRGPLVAAEGISRAAVSLPLNFAEGGFTGGVHSSGSKFAGQAGGILSAGSLQLTRRP